MKFQTIKKIGRIALLAPIIYFLQERDINTPTAGIKLYKDKRKIIVLDPGHGMSNRKFGVMDWGDAKYKDYREADITLKEAENIKKMLNPNLYNVILTRIDNYKSAPINSRPELANRLNADMFVSLHVNNNFKNRNMHGFEVYYRDDKSKELAKLAAKNLECITSLSKRLIKKKNYLMLKGINCPSILVEGGYLPRDRNIILDSSKYVEKAVVRTIEDSFGN